jgi:hypothetical protein
MPKFTYSAMDRVPDSERVRIGYRYRDILESYSCRTCYQKLAATSMPFMLAYIYFKEYQLKYSHYPVLRASAMISTFKPKQLAHYLVPIVSLGVGLWFLELSYNRCVLGIQGTEPIPDQIIKRESYP